MRLGNWAIAKGADLPSPTILKEPGTDAMRNMPLYGVTVYILNKNKV